MTAAAKPAFPYKTPPFGDYQRDALRRSAMAPFFFLAMEQGTGKTWVTINTAVALWLHKKIDGMIVLAPNGVHAQWALEQIPQHMAECVPYRTHIWSSAKERSLFNRNKRKATPTQHRENWPVYAMAADQSCFPILCVNSETVTVRLALKAIGTMLTMRRCLLVVDESGDFSKPSGKRTRALMKLRARAPYRRCLDGTPMSVSPFELYAPYRFLSPSILGYETFADMKEAHAEWDEHLVQGGTRTFKTIRREHGQPIYKNLDVIARRIAPYTVRITKAEALPFLPPKRYAKLFFELTEEQWRLTHELLKEMTTTLSSGSTVTATSVLTRYLRFQQIACGYVPPDVVFGEEAEPVHFIPGPNPRLELCVEELLRYRGAPAIVWTRYQLDIDLLKPRLEAEGFRVVTYDGRTTPAEREAAKMDFQSGKVNVFLGNPAAGGRGLNLQAAQFEIFYANYFGYRRRAQAEDRGHRIGTKTSVKITDLIGLHSIDTVIVRALRANKDVADIITGDPATEWI